MPRFASLALVVLAYASLACVPSSLAHDSAPVIGCDEGDITIDEMHVPLQGPSSWRATCKGFEFLCSRDYERVICTQVPR